MTKVSIMIPTYNQPQYIEQCLQSAMAQDYPELEIIVSDDSTDGETERIIRAKYLHDPRIKYFRNEKRLGRVGNYHHTLYEKATGEYVLNLDGDDWFVDNGYIKEAAGILDRHEDVVCVMARIIHEHQDTGKREYGAGYEMFHAIDEGNEYLSALAKRKTPFNHLTALYRRNRALEIGFYNQDTTWTDSESLFRLFCGGRVGFVNRHVAVWRLHETNESKSFFKHIRFEELDRNVYTISKYFRQSGCMEGCRIRKWVFFSLLASLKNVSKQYIKEKKISELAATYGFVFRKHKLMGLILIPTALGSIPGGYVVRKIFRRKAA